MKTERPIYQLSLAEQAQRLQPILDKVQQENLAAGSFNVYRDSNCTTKDLFVREYADRKELVQVNAAAGHTRTVKRLTP